MSYTTRAKIQSDQRAQTKMYLIIQPSSKPHSDDNESLPAESAGIEPDPVCRGNRRGTSAAAVPLSPVTSLYPALAD